MSAKIFINYRRDDSPWNSVALYQELIEHFPKESIFKDFNNIKPGRDYVESIENALETCDVLLVLISKNWLTITNEKGMRRLDEENDFVRLEIATALRRNIIVIPILFDGSIMPGAVDLPDDLKNLARRQYFEIDKTRFESDTAMLVQTIKEQIPEEVKGGRLTGNPVIVTEPSRNNRLKYYLIGLVGLILVYILSAKLNSNHNPIQNDPLKPSPIDTTDVKPNNRKDTIENKEVSKPIFITLVANPQPAYLGGKTEITVNAYDELKSPLKYEQIDLEVSGEFGIFPASGTGWISGYTDKNGVFTTNVNISENAGSKLVVTAQVTERKIPKSIWINIIPKPISKTRVAVRSPK